MNHQQQVINVGVAGLGQGRAHLASFQALEESTVVAVADLDTELRHQVASSFEVSRMYASVDQLVEDKDIDLVVIATPDHMHGRHVIRALESGKHVLSEIPMALSIDDCMRIIEITDRTGLKYAMGNQVRYAHCLQDIQQLIRRGELGDIFYGEGEYLHSLVDDVWKRRGNHWRITETDPQTTLLGGGPHALDTLRWLMGVRFTKASAFHSAHQTEWETTHTTVAIFQAESGSAAKITTSYAMERPYCLYFSVYGSEGSFERSRLQGEQGGDTTNYHYHSKLAGTNHMIPVTLPNFSNPEVLRTQANVGHGTMEFEQARDLLQAILDDTEPALGPREAAASCVPLICGLQVADDGGGMMNIPSLG